MILKCLAIQSRIGLKITSASSRQEQRGSLQELKKAF